MDINYKKLENTPDDLFRLRSLLYDFNEAFSPSLSDVKADFDSFSLQLINNAIVIVAVHERSTLGFVAIYANNNENRTAFVSLIAVKAGYFGQKIGTQLLSRAENYASQNSMTSIELEVKQNNSRALKFYNHHGYVRFNHANNSFFLKKSLIEIDFEVR